MRNREPERVIDIFDTSTFYPTLPEKGLEVGPKQSDKPTINISLLDLVTFRPQLKKS